jgi:pimeloyl-ACP methyl ester carboxylesterase
VAPPQGIFGGGYVCRVAQWLELEHEGVRFACRDFGGTGRSVLFLHGLAGHSGEWAETAAALGDSFRIIGLDQRGHGRSEHAPRDVSRRAFVADVAQVVDDLSLGPVVLVGQSMGGNTAFLATAAFPDIVEAVVVVEASPDGPAPALPGRIRQWLDSWPVPFPDERTAREFFASQGLSPAAWVEGLVRHGDGLRPTFNNDVLVDCVSELAGRDYWKEWREIQCPTLIVSGQHGNLPIEHAAEMAQAISRGKTVSIPGAGHDVHLDAPKPLGLAIRNFLG